MKNQSLQTLYYLTIFMFIVFSSCEKDNVSSGNFHVVRTNGDIGENQFSGGWIGSENDDQLYQDILTFGNGNLPSKIDLTSYLPPVQSQGQYGTCVAWATGYYTKTAMNAIDGQYTTNQLQQPVRQASPKDLFWAIPQNQKGSNCEGTHFEYAFNSLLGRGIATMQTVPYEDLGNCSDQPYPSWTNEAADHRIDSYRQLPVDVNAIREKLAEKRPLVFGAIMTNAFTGWRNSSTMTANQILDGSQLGGHAMTIVGYDDGKNAFRIVNSWGTNWGDNGFAWIDYGLMTNPDFCKYIFVAYNTPGGITPPDNPNNNNSSKPDLVVTELHDWDNENEPDPLERRIVYDVKNTGNQNLPASKDWSVIYMYYNAFDANDYEILIHQYITNDFGGPNSDGYYGDGYGYSSNWWYNENLPAQGELADEMFGGDYRISWQFDMPPINGYYYLAMIVDPFEDVEESNESDNIFFLTADDGGPIWFDDGVGYGLTDGSIEDRSASNTSYANAYRPEEIRRFIQHLKDSGQLKAGLGAATSVAPEAER